MENDDLLATLRTLERKLHRVDQSTPVAQIEALLHPDFEEFGRSGRRYSRADIVDELMSVAVHRNVVSGEYAVRRVADGLALLTYRSAHRRKSGALHRQSLRSSLWQKTAAGWQMLFHQGTPIAGSVD